MYSNICEYDTVVLYVCVFPIVIVTSITIIMIKHNHTNDMDIMCVLLYMAFVLLVTPAAGIGGPWSLWMIRSKISSGKDSYDDKRRNEYLPTCIDIYPSMAWHSIA